MRIFNESQIHDGNTITTHAHDSNQGILEFINANDQSKPSDRYGDSILQHIDAEQESSSAGANEYN